MQGIRLCSNVLDKREKKTKEAESEGVGVRVKVVRSHGKGGLIRKMSGKVRKGWSDKGVGRVGMGRR